jgi:Fe-S oxidoreductase
MLEADREIPALSAVVGEVSSGCTRCGACVLKCDFLARYGAPADIARDYDPESAGTMPFECSLCGLCGSVCPEGLQPADMFLAMRRRAVDRGEAPYRGHSRILNYERRGISPAYTLEALPDGCDTVFFPGCSLPGTRPGSTLKIFNMLREADPRMGVVMHCCGKPSHDLGMSERFRSVFSLLHRRLLDAGVRRVLTGCPNCHKVVARYGEGLDVLSVYESLAERDFNRETAAAGVEACVHDSCAVREYAGIHAAARRLAGGAGLTLTEMKSAGRKTLCCGEGGDVVSVAPDLAFAWTRKRVEQAGGKKLVTYCAGCNAFLSPSADAVHLADLVADPKRALSGRARVRRAPFTYFNRRLLKRRLARMVAGS